MGSQVFTCTSNINCFLLHQVTPWASRLGGPSAEQPGRVATSETQRSLVGRRARSMMHDFVSWYDFLWVLLLLCFSCFLGVTMILDGGDDENI